MRKRESELSAPNVPSNYVRDWIAASASKIHRATYVLSRVTNGQLQPPIGSATLLDVSDNLFLLTAAHVLADVDPREPLQFRNAFGWGLAGPRAGHPERGELSDNRLIDAGVIAVGNDVVSDAMKAHAVTPDDLEPRATVRGQFMFVRGIPASQFKSRKPVSLGDPTLHQTWIGPVMDPATVDREGYDPRWAIGFHFQPRKARDKDNQPRTGSDPQGVSGGGLWVIPREDELIIQFQRPLLAGTLWHQSPRNVEYKKIRHLIGTSIGAHMTIISEMRPDLKDALWAPARFRNLAAMMVQLGPRFLRKPAQADAETDSAQ